ncbi:hypothetical protein H5410_004999 [Solanum commersonii]|uniref:Uncharacterized protein n=1 Tax=Solanum commersonii TaxID=4109 RepID=A0A9J6A5E7_SOLCO|nr:hypothetical protein H5410_004999 [Solanum commersonii]
MEKDIKPHHYYNGRFYHLKLEEESKNLTTFTVPQGFYEWNVLPFGYKNAPDKTTQTEKESTLEDILKAITTLCSKVDSMDNEICQSEDTKHPELEGDVGILQKTHNYCFNAAAVYTYDGEEQSGIPKIHKAFITYKRVRKGNLFYVKFYAAPVEILSDEIKPIIQVVKIGLTRGMIIPEDIGQQQEIQEIEIPSFYANKRIIGMSTIIQELSNNYLNGNAIWSYYSRDQLMIYSNSRELRQADMDEVQKWILSLLKPEEQPIIKALKKGFISNELLTRYCKLIGHKYPDHICSECNGEIM